MEQKPLLIRRIDTIILLLILVIAFTFRMYKMTPIVADFHSWRQVDTAAVARNFVRNGFDLLHPTYDDFSNVQTGKENPHGYRFLEFPLYNAAIALAYIFMPFFYLETWGRLITIVASLGIIAVIYYLLVKEHSRTAAIAGSLLYATFPFFVFFSRVILPDTVSVAFALAAIFFLYKYTHESTTPTISTVNYILSLVLFMAGLLVKPQVIFYCIPLAYLFLLKYKFSLIKKIDFFLYFIIAAIPLIAWRTYIKNYPEGVPVNSWLFTSVNTGGGLQPIFFRPAFFRWIFFERINNIILGGYVTVLLVVGGLAKTKSYFIHSILLAALAYLFVFQGGNVQHEYYQINILPAIALAVGIGTALLLQAKTKLISPVLVYPVVISMFLFSFFISYSHVKDYYNYSDDLVKIARYINSVTHQDDKIVTDTLGDTTLLYLMDRKGAPSVYKSLPELKASGYKYFVTLNKGVAEDVEKQFHYTIVGQNDKFTLFKL